VGLIEEESRGDELRSKMALPVLWSKIFKMEGI